MGISAAKLTKLVDSQAPILLLDTCTVLDIVRDITRPTMDPHNASVGFDLLHLAEAGKLNLLVAQQVEVEYLDNIAVVLQEADAALKKFQEQAKRIDQVAKVFGAQGVSETSHLDDHINRSRAAAIRWLNAATRIVPTGQVVQLAFARVQNAMTPAAKGKESMKDCVVFETYMEAMKAIRAAGITARAVFASSNTKDYRPGRSSSVPTDFAIDLATTGLQYAASFHEARHYLKV